MARIWLVRMAILVKILSIFSAGKLTSKACHIYNLFNKNNDLYNKIFGFKAYFLTYSGLKLGLKIAIKFLEK